MECSMEVRSERWILDDAQGNQDRNLSTTNAVQGPSSWRHRFYANLVAFGSRFFSLVREPKHFASLVLDYWLLVHSIWSRKQAGPDLVYPMLGIRKRQSGHLARLILEHSRDEQSYEFHTATPFPKGIDPPCVAVIELDKVPQAVVENGYSTQVDLYGFMCLLTLIDIIITLVLHVFYMWDRGWITWLNWAYCATHNLAFCLYAVGRGDGTLTLAQRSDASAPGCAVLLDQDFTVILNGNQSVVEAVAESSFNLSHPNAAWTPYLRRTRFTYDLSYQALEAFCEGLCIAVLSGFWLLFRPSSRLGGVAPLAIIILISTLVQEKDLPESSTLEEVLFVITGGVIRGFPSIVFISAYEQAMVKDSGFAFEWQHSLHILPEILFIILCASYRSRKYPIRTTKFLDALGDPQVKKWEFDTLAAAVTFQCLVLCRGIPHPVRSIDVPGFLDMLVPDQRDVWKAWKERVADRIVHEVDISFAPTIPTFGDQRQEQLKDLLVEAQSAYELYGYVYEQKHLPEWASQGLRVESEVWQCPRCYCSHLKR